MESRLKGTGGVRVDCRSRDCYFFEFRLKVSFSSHRVEGIICGELSGDYKSPIGDYTE
ncbi:hypothetical protein HanRHA438_Chr08g0354921 [Helianthus annuus]|nr:hypothetical protein HanRHA438_Chr08g0354921 [Helianthus annuus]